MKLDTSSLPKDPGCYLYKNSSGAIIYVGKAKSIRKRVSSYFAKNHPDKKTQQLVQSIRSVDFFVTRNEVEALLLENTLIKKHQPRYNIDLKDSKRYAYLQLTNDAFPRLITARQKPKDGTYFGPFVSGYAREQIRVLLNKTFGLRTCKRLPKRACLRYHIGLCSGPCIGKRTKEEYADDVKRASMVLRGKTKRILGTMETQMKKYSAKQQFEKALLVRDQIYSLKRLDEKQTVERKKRYDEDIFHYVIREEKVYLILFNIYKGTLLNKHEFCFDYKDSCIEEFMVQYYSDHDVPKVVLVPSAMDPSLQEFLTKKRKSKVQVVVPKVGERKKLLDLVLRNVEITFFGNMGKVEELKKAIKLQDNPTVIECFDISHLSGTSMVGSMVQFRNGRPDKSNYRRFKIRTVEGIDDFRSIAEVVSRRYKRLLAEKAELPGLIIIDGGKGQLTFALEELKKLGLRIPTISLAKKFEEVYVPGLRIPIRLDHKSTALRFLQEIRDEAHRFAITYNRLLRKKKIREE